MFEPNEVIVTSGHTAEDGTLKLSVKIGIPNADVAVTVQVRRLTRSEQLDENGWPLGYFEKIPGSMPDLERAPQVAFEKRQSLE